MSTTTETDNSHLLRALEEHVILFSPTLGWWEGRYQLPKKRTTVELGGREVTRGITTPRTIMLDDTCPVDSQGVPWRKRLQGINSRKTALVEKYSIPFPIRGVRMVPKRVAGEFFRELFGLTLGDLQSRCRQLVAEGRENSDECRDLDARIAAVYRSDPDAERYTPVYDPDREEQSVAYDFYQATLEFVGGLDSVLQQVQANLDEDVWQAVEHKVPKRPAAMRAKFHLDGVPVEIAGGNRGSEVSLGALEQYRGLVQDSIRRKVSEAVEALISNPLDQLAEALGNLNDLIARDGRVTERSFGPVRDALQKIQMFAFAIRDEDILRQLNELEQGLNNTSARNLDSVTAARNGFSRLLNDTLSVIEDAERRASGIEEFGREFRALDLG